LAIGGTLKHGGAMQLKPIHPWDKSINVQT